MFCRNCGTQINSGIKFCPNCGRQIVVSDKNNSTNNRRKIQTILCVGIVIVIVATIFGATSKIWKRTGKTNKKSENSVASEDYINGEENSLAGEGETVSVSEEVNGDIQEEPVLEKNFEDYTEAEQEALAEKYMYLMQPYLKVFADIALTDINAGSLLDDSQYEALWFWACFLKGFNKEYMESDCQPIEWATPEYVQGRDPRGYTSNGYYTIDWISTDFLLFEMFNDSLMTDYINDNKGNFLYVDSSQAKLIYNFDNYNYNNDRIIFSIDFVNVRYGNASFLVNVDGFYYYIEASLRERSPGDLYWCCFKISHNIREGMIEIVDEKNAKKIQETFGKNHTTSEISEDVYGTYVGILRKKECYSMADDSYIVDFLDFGEEKEITTLGFDEDWNEAVYKVRIDGLVVHADGINLDSYMNKKIEVYGRVTEAATGGTIIQAERINVVN